MSPDASRAIRVGLIAAPGAPGDLAEGLAEDLPELLSERVSADVDWAVPMVIDDLAADPSHGGVGMIDQARRRMLEEGWDFAICLTDLPIRISGRPVVADASAQHGVGLISLPALGALHQRRRAADAVVWLVEGVLGESLELGRVDGEARRRRMRRRLADLAAPVRRVRPDDDDVDVRFVAAVVRGNLRLLFGMVRTNRPWRLVTGLSRALAAALAAVVFAVVTSDIWRLADTLSWPRLLALTVGSVAATVVSLIVAHELWERPRDDCRREQVVLFNVATALTLLLGIAVLYLALFLLTLAGAALIIDPGAFRHGVSHAVAVGDYAGLAWFVSSLATVGGALGAALESDAEVREAAYGYRPERRTERDAGPARTGAHA